MMVVGVATWRSSVRLQLVNFWYIYRSGNNVFNFIDIYIYNSLSLNLLVPMLAV